MSTRNGISQSKSGLETKEEAKVMWDRSGSVVDAEALGTAIEGFLRRNDAQQKETKTPDTSKGAIPKTIAVSKTSPKPTPSNQSGWYSSVKDGDEDGADTCDTSLCSTLKDLFVK